MGCLLAFLPMLGACDSTFKWKEEIRLHDGRIVIAERVDVLGGRHEPGQSASEKVRTINFADPSNAKKRYTHSVTGSSNYGVVDFIDGVPWMVVLVGPFSDGTKCPVGSYETITWINGGWRSVSYADLPKKIKTTNMAYGYAPDQPEMRKAGELLTADKINYIIKKSSRLGAVSSSYQLVETNGAGRPMDCEYYGELAKEGKR